MTDAVTATIATYALNLLHGAKLADFERDNLIALAESVGVYVTEKHRTMEVNVAVAQAAKEDELQRLRAIAAEKRRPWWRRWV